MKQAITQYLMVIMMVVGSYFIGVYKTKSEILAKGATLGTAAPTAAAAQPAAQQQGEPTVTSDQVKALFNKDNLVFGKDNAKLSIVEFSDPSCPYCHVAGGKNPELNNQIGSQFKMVADGGSYVPPMPEIKKLVDEGKAKLVWFYTPGHGNGEMGTKALYCANEKGKFWEVNDLLMSSKGYDLLNNTVKNDVKNAKTLADFLAPAMKAGDMQKCLESGKYDARVTSDPKIVASVGQFGTPTFVFGTTIFQGAQPYDKGMSAVVDAALK
ncbi:MAG: thioredoxin domain-containing protein [bacterium]